MIQAALLNHLWQSTLFAAAVWLASLTLRSNGARVRYWLWTAASVKFLVPFSWLVSFGAQFEWRTAPAVTYPAASFVMEEVLTPPVLASPPTVAMPPSYVLPSVLFAVWIAGTVLVLFWWWRQWRPVQAALRQAVPLDLGPMYDTSGIRVMSSPSALEPGVVGIGRPVLLVPDGLLDRLTPPQLSALIAHERSHIRCHDNLVAAVHMLVEAIFWFHPLVWWIERRMIDERERACDEAVLRGGNDPSDYAQGILTVCRFTVRAPLACVTGVTGSDLRRRIESIAQREFGTHMTVARRVALAAFIASLIGIPFMVGVVKAESPLVTVGQEPAAPVFFEVAVVRANTSGSTSTLFQDPKGGGFTVTNAELRLLITYAYQIRGNQLVNAPDWIRTARYDINARLDGEPPAVPRGQPDARRLALRSLLADRFRLVVHRETREAPMFALVMARPGGKPGPNLKPSSADCSPEIMQARRAAFLAGRPMPGTCGTVFNGGRMRFGGSMSEFAREISPHDDRMVVDRTGLGGNWELELTWAPARPAGLDAAVIDPSAPPPFVTALHDQLGLKLEPITGKLEVLVVDRVERLTDDQASAVPQPAPARPAFEVASIRRTPDGVTSPSFGVVPKGRLSATNNPTMNFIQNGYGVPNYRILNAPDWLSFERYDLEARAVGEPSRGQMMLMLQTLLESRFGLKVHPETREGPVYVLGVAKGGLKLSRFQEGSCVDRSPGAVLSPGEKRPGCGNNLMTSNGANILWVATRINMAGVADAMGRELRRTVIDKTGVTGLFDIRVELPPLEPQPGISDPAAANSGASVFTVLREQLGLTLEPGRGPVEYLVIDAVNRPSGN